MTKPCRHHKKCLVTNCPIHPLYPIIEYHDEDNCKQSLEKRSQLAKKSKPIHHGKRISELFRAKQL